MKLFTIGFTKKSAERFFGLLRDSGAERVVDVRLHNVSQLTGFSKKTDLPFFLREICEMDYLHLPELAPSEELFNGIKKEGLAWHDYERGFLRLMRKRKIEECVPREAIDGGCLLCTEPSAEHCHRRLVAEYLAEAWGDIEIVHLM